MDIHRLPRVRHLALALLAALGLVVAAAAPSSASPAPRGTYLALGDSVPFGFFNSPFDPTTQPAQFAAFYRNPKRFHSYADIVARDRKLRLLNGSCPGETTGSFIDGTTDVYKCEPPVGYRSFAPLHVDYAGAQLDYAKSVLTDPRSHVQLVTLQLGSNDAFLCQAVTPPCTSQAAVTAVAATVNQRLSTILDELRATGYAGPIVVVDYYALDYADPTGVGGVLLLDGAIDSAALAHGATVASGFAAFRPVAVAKGDGSSIAAGLVRKNDVHPTPTGQRLLARAVELADS